MESLKQKFLFRCEDCQAIISVELDSKEDLEDVHEDRLVFECTCGGKSYTLRN